MKITRQKKRVRICEKRTILIHDGHMIQWLHKKLRCYCSRHLEGKFPFSKFSSLPPYLFHFNRKSVSKGTFIGLFINFLPIPLQAICAMSLAIALCANVPMAVSLTWINNPFTFIPITLFIYKIGSYFTGEDISFIDLPAWQWHFEGFKEFWRGISSRFLMLGKSYLIGLPIVSLSTDFLGYIIVQCVWKTYIMMQIRRRRKQKNKKSTNRSNDSCPGLRLQKMRRLKAEKSSCIKSRQIKMSAFSLLN